MDCLCKLTRDVKIWIPGFINIIRTSTTGRSKSLTGNIWPVGRSVPMPAQDKSPAAGTVPVICRGLLWHHRAARPLQQRPPLGSCHWRRKRAWWRSSLCPGPGGPRRAKTTCWICYVQAQMVIRMCWQQNLRYFSHHSVKSNTAHRMVVISGICSC